jgi:hypothetical protein
MIGPAPHLSNRRLTEKEVLPTVSSRRIPLLSGTTTQLSFELRHNPNEDQDLRFQVDEQVRIIIQGGWRISHATAYRLIHNDHRHR